MKKLFFIALLGAITFVGCQNDDDASMVVRNGIEKSNGFTISPQDESKINNNTRYIIKNRLRAFGGTELLCGSPWDGTRYTGTWKGFTKTTLANGTVVIHEVSGFYSGFDDVNGQPGISFTVTSMKVYAINPISLPC